MSFGDAYDTLFQFLFEGVMAFGMKCQHIVSRACRVFVLPTPVDSGGVHEL
jgi:hypothetical protein